MTLRTLISCAALIITVTAVAQDDTPTKPSDSVKTTTTTTVVSEEVTDWGLDDQNARGQIGMSGVRLPGKRKKIETTTEFTRTIELNHPATTLECEADIDLTYYQKDSIVEVRTQLSSANCTEFDAEYQLNVAYFDADRKFQRIKRDAEWPQDATAPVVNEIALSPDAELKRVSPRVIRCVCRDVAQ